MGELFCSGCGFPLMVAVPPRESPHVKPSDNYVQCPRQECGELNPSGNAFCYYCGAALSAERVAAEPLSRPSVAGARLMLTNKTLVRLAENARSLGRDDLANIIAEENMKYVSRRHILLTFDNGRYYVEDENSTNGTRLNGLEIRGNGKRMLKEGDQLELAGVVKLTFAIS